MLNFLENLFYYLAILAMVGGIVVYIASYFLSLIPFIPFPSGTVKTIGIVLFIGGGYFVAEHRGYERRVAEDQIEIIRLNTEARAKEQELKDKLEKSSSILRKAQDDIKTKQSIIDKRVDSGELRFPTSCGVQANSGSSNGNTANGSNTERQAIKDIVSIAAEGDTAITNLNACISQYNQVRDVVNKGVK